MKKTDCCSAPSFRRSTECLNCGQIPAVVAANADIATRRGGTVKTSVKAYRVAADHLLDLANVHWRACVVEIEVNNWLLAAERSLLEVAEMVCPTAKPDDEARMKRAIAAVRHRIAESGARKAELHERQ